VVKESARAIIVPARLESVRFPRKLLYEVRGLPIILHTARQIQNVMPSVPLYFAVADRELLDLLRGEGYDCVKTDPSLASGTDRIAAANREICADYVVNVQADEPLVTGEQIRALFAMLSGDVDMSTLGVYLDSYERWTDPNQVKIVRGLDGRALYFSRSPIPFDRDQTGKSLASENSDSAWLGHLGLYGYRADFLEKFVSLPPSPLEKSEKLEQLRALENGFQIQVGISEDKSVGVDVPADIERLEMALDQSKSRK